MKHYTDSALPGLMRLREKYLPCKVASLTDLLWLVNKVLDGTVLVGDLATLKQDELLAVAIEACGRQREACKDLSTPVDPTDPREVLARNVVQYLHMIPIGMAFIAIRDAAGGHENPHVGWCCRFIPKRPEWFRLIMKIRACLNSEFPDLMTT